MLTDTVAYVKELNGGFVLKSVASDQDVRRLARFNAEVHRSSKIGDMTRCLILDHPATRPEGCLYVEDTKSGAVVSSLCLIPWRIRFEDIELAAGEMGMVGTKKEYRRKGLIRCQVERFNELLEMGHYDISHIQRIPYFYRQFGYEFAIPLEPRWRVDLDKIPDTDKGKNKRFTFHPAGSEDLPELMRLFNEANRRLKVRTVRQESVWHYLLGPSLETEMAADTWIVMNKLEDSVSYFRASRHGFGAGLIVSEAGPMTHDVALAVLSKCKGLAEEKRKPYIRLNLPEGSDLVETSRALGAYNPRSWAWQIRIVSLEMLLKKLVPVFERRVAQSPFAGLTQTVCLNLYRKAFDIRFERGRCREVTPVGYRDFRDRSGICLPPPLMVPLLFGYHTPGELLQTNHDFLIDGKWRHLMETLFPPVESFLYTIY
jgi:hypothetical protein